METNGNKLLTVKDLTKSYGSVRVLTDVGFELERGKVFAICGENGAGKSTLINILGGILPKNSGQIVFRGKDYNPQSAKDAAAIGISIIHQELNLFSNLTIAENIYMSCMPKSRIPCLINRKKMVEDSTKYLKLLDDTIDANAKVESLTIGQKQMTEIAKALSSKADLIVFDEPTTSLSAKEKAKLFSVIEELAKKGVAIIYISHELDEVFHLSDEIMVLRDGMSIIQKPTAEITKGEVIQKMVGREMGSLSEYVEREIGDVVYSVMNLTAKREFENVSLQVREGEIVGMFGLMGAGRSEVMRAAFGIDRYDSGEVIVLNEKVKQPTPKDSIARGVAFVTENRRDEGLLMRKNLTSNLSLASLKTFQRRCFRANKKKEQTESERIIRRLNVKTYDMNRQLALNLSGGNQQKVVIGKWLMTNPKVIILDEPTKGVDIGAKFEIYKYINELAVNRSAVLMISSEMEELMGICDRIIVMYKGRVSGEIQRDEFSKERLLTLALGGDSK